MNAVIPTPLPTLQRAIPEPRFWRDCLGVSPAQGRILRDTDPAYPHAMQVGVNRRAIGEVDGAEYQEALRMRALAERRKPTIRKCAQGCGALG